MFPGEFAAEAKFQPEMLQHHPVHVSLEVSPAVVNGIYFCRCVCAPFVTAQR